jgi:hypothetical protein
LLYAHLPARNPRPAATGYIVRDAAGGRVPVRIVGLRIDETAGGSVVLSRVAETGEKINPTEHNRQRQARGGRRVFRS